VRQDPLPDYYPTVAADILRLCRPCGDGLWVDLGSGEGPVALALVERSDARMILIDPDTEALSKAIQRATARGQGGRILALSGRSEQLPLVDDSADLVVSRGSIYFWRDPAQGLAEAYRILRPGGQAMIGGGLGSDYPQWARQEFIRRRHEGVRNRGDEAYGAFLHLRSPEVFGEWVLQAGLPDYEIIGEGGQAAEDHRAGIGIWLRFSK